MSQISRLKSAQIQNGNLINADDINSELNQQVNESNSQDTRLSTIESGAFTQTGTFSTSNNIVTNGLSERSIGAGILADNTRLQDGYANLQAILATVSSVDIINDALVFSANHNLSTGTPVRVRVLPGGTLPGGIVSNLTYYIFAASTTTLKLYTTAANASTAGITGLIDITSIGSGNIQVVGIPTGLQEGDVFVHANGLSVYLNGIVKTIMGNDGIPLPRNYSRSAPPRYNTATSFSVESIQERSNDDSSNIIKNTSTILDITTAGLNGIAQSSNLTGTVTVTAGSNSVSFSNSQTGSLQAGDIILTAGGQARKLISVSGVSAVVESQFASTESTVSFKRGARPSFYTANTSGSVGTAFLYLYAISDGVTPGLILSTRNMAAGDILVDLPSGYNQVRQLSFALTLSNISTAAGIYFGNILPFKIASGWPQRPLILYSTSITAYIGSGTVIGNNNILNNGTSTTYSSVSASNYIPPLSRLGYLACYGASSPTSLVYQIRAAGSTNLQLSVHGYGNVAIQGYCETDASQSVEYIKVLGNSGLYLDVVGYVIDQMGS